jgi:hypothetical protein
MQAEQPLDQQQQQQILENRRDFLVFTADQTRRLNNTYHLTKEVSTGFFDDLYTSFEQDKHLQIHLKSIDDELFQSIPEPEVAKKHYTTALIYALLYTDDSLQCQTLDNAKNLLTARMETLKDAIDPHVVVSFLGQHQAQAANDPTSLLKQDIFGQGNTSAPTGQ